MMDEELRAVYAKYHRDISAAHHQLAEALQPRAPRQLGRTQERALQLLRDLDVEGATARYASVALDYDIGNIYQVFGSLVKQGLAEKVPDTYPQRWRAH
jgi:CRP-like cAMP-binding protein